MILSDNTDQQQRGLNYYFFRQPQFNSSRMMTYQNCIDMFEIITTLGYGTFGRVKLVRLKNTRQYYAMKVMKKIDIVKQKQVTHVKSQKDVLMELSHPFIVQLKTSFQDTKRVYMIFEYIPGGELFSKLTKSGRFSNDIAIFYISQVLDAICYMHSKNVIFRDIKPENIMIDSSGHTKIIDLGFAKKLDAGRTFTLCGTPEYLAPEILKDQKMGYGKAVDYWGVGVLIYELLAGYPPFYDSENPKNIYKKIIKGEIEFPDFFSLRAKHIIIKLLNPDKEQRLGYNSNGQQIKNHAWFSRVDWKNIRNKSTKVPWKPVLKNNRDYSNFSEVTESQSYPSTIAIEDHYAFDDF